MLAEIESWSPRIKRSDLVWVGTGGNPLGRCVRARRVRRRGILYHPQTRHQSAGLRGGAVVSCDGLCVSCGILWRLTSRTVRRRSMRQVRRVLSTQYPKCWQERRLSRVVRAGPLPLRSTISLLCSLPRLMRAQDRRQGSPICLCGSNCDHLPEHRPYGPDRERSIQCRRGGGVPDKSLTEVDCVGAM